MAICCTACGGAKCTGRERRARVGPPGAPASGGEPGAERAGRRHSRHLMKLTLKRSLRLNATPAALAIQLPAALARP